MRGELAHYLDALLKDSEQLAATIDFIMESDALGHSIMDQRQGHKSLVVIDGTVTLEEVNGVGAKLLEYISDFGQLPAPLPTAIVACVPMKVHLDDTGKTEFKISLKEIATAMEVGLKEPIEPEPEPELEIPKELVSHNVLQELRFERNPSFVAFGDEANSTKIFDKEIGITQLRLSNGLFVNYKDDEWWRLQLNGMDGMKATWMSCF